MDHKPQPSENRDSQSDFLHPPIEAKKSRWGFRGMTVREWLELLIVPVVLALITVVFTWQQNERQQVLETKRTNHAQEIENQRAEAERKLAVQRAQDEALQAYLNQMGSLLLENGLRKSEEGSEERTLARARTLTVLGRLDTSHKTPVMQFLVEADLVQRVEGRDPIISLTGADLSGAYLGEANLSGLRYADLSGANLFKADLSGANLFKANLSEAGLSEADLSGVSLRRANVSWADLRGADLTRANLREANLSEAKLNGANLSEANLSEAKLNGANLSEANLTSTNLRGADLSGAFLRDANLRYANLRDAKMSFALEQLKKQAASLKGAVMPDGTVSSDEFEPALSFSLSEEWQIAEVTPPDLISIHGPERGKLFFTSPSHVFDPSSPSEPTKVSAPETAKEWLSWFQRHPNLDTSKPVPVSVGGESGMQIDVAASSTLEDFPEKVCYTGPCVPLYPTTGGPIIAQPSDEGGKDRYVMVDVRGETVVINVIAPAGKVDEFLPKAQKVLDSVEWKGG
jgi:uncharacterized protein YjbI with pentapeptide repeats